MEFHEISDEEWAFIKPFLLLKTRADDRLTINGILYALIKHAKKGLSVWIEYSRL
ncbi:MAG: hypothetical protein QW589_03970 [Candidatus Bathyarchaeia archaeon]